MRLGLGMDVRRGGAPFLPTQLPGLALWLRADLGITIGTGVSAWADQSASALSFVQGTGAQQPTFTTSSPTWNNRPIVTFNSAASQVLAATTSMLGGLAARTMFVALRQTAIEAVQHMVIGSSSGSFRIQTFSGSYYDNVGTGNNVSGLSNTTTPKVWEDVYDGSQATNATKLQQLVNGVSIVSANAGTIPAATPALTYLCVGAELNTGANGWTGDIAEVLTFSRILSTAERSRVRQYLGARYGIAVTP